MADSKRQRSRKKAQKSKSRPASESTLPYGIHRPFIQSTTNTLMVSAPRVYQVFG